MGEDSRADDDLAAGVPLAGLGLFPRSPQGQPGVNLGAFAAKGLDPPIGCFCF
jgi:hypothetical protein